MKRLLSFKFIATALIIALFYLILSVYLMNWSLVLDTIFGQFPLSYKIELLINLLQGVGSVMSSFNLISLIIISFLTGMNLTLIASRLASLGKSGNLQLMVGGSSFFGLTGSGCIACGLPILTFLGLGGSIAYLPFKGSEISIIAITLLAISIYLIVKSGNLKQTCAINIRTAST